jgi:hypothetical protein
LDSLPGALGVLRLELRQRDLDPSYRNVTVSLQTAPNAPRQGGACATGTGIVIRGAADALRAATIYLDAPGVVEVWIVDGEGRPLVMPVRIGPGDRAATIKWGK